ncbi:MAG TPA: DUF222 domain-containing protein [Acidimicrobiales bacterium]|nr:DUF222 domain-containing protein [Acidimicrobiales bacterium]
MSLEFVGAAVTFRGLVREMDVGVMEAKLCVLVAEEMARVEKACAALRAMAAARAAYCGAHRERGFNSPEDWLAGASGSTRSQAKSDIQTGSRLEDLPETKDAALQGDLSLGQAEEIARTEKEKPGSESEMIKTAKSSTRQQLADAGRKLRQEGVDRKELAKDQHAKRGVRSWIDGDGMICGQFRFEPVVGVPLATRLVAEADRIHREARRNGSTESWEAHAADALAAMMGEGGAKPHRTKADVVFVVDLRTFRTGEHPETVSHIVGGGPVDPEVVREMAKDAFLKVVFHDGVNIHTVAHLGRYIPAELRTALELGDPPEFDGITCSGCGKKFNLQWDHLDPVCAGGLTSYDNEDPKCWECHAKKCDEERAAGLYKPKPKPDFSSSVGHQGQTRTPASSSRSG